MILYKKEHQFSDKKIGYDVMEKEQIKEIASKLDEWEIKLMVRVESLKHFQTGIATAELSLVTGEVIYSWLDHGDLDLSPDLYVTLCFKDGTNELVYNENIDYDIDRIYEKEL